jgi:hypothetical protein
MRNLLLVSLIGLVAALLTAPRAIPQENDWVDLFGNDLRDWERSGFGKTPWRFTTNRTLICQDGSELFLPDREFRDGTIKFEYRFRPTGEKFGYKGAVWARRTLSESGCRVALGDDCGAMSASFQGGSDRTKTLNEKPATSPAKPIGDWNQVRIRLEGRSVTVFINDKEAASFNRCDTVGGLFALEADGSEIEFRDLLWKEGK